MSRNYPKTVSGIKATGPLLITSERDTMNLLGKENL
jgi:hypothetical protein